MSTRVTYRLDDGEKEMEICFSSPWRKHTNWKRLTYYPTLYNGFKRIYFDKVGMDFPAVTAYWNQTLKLWGINLFDNELTAENWERGFTVPNTLPNSGSFVALTAIRYLDEYQEVIYQMIRLGADYPDVFYGSGEKLWNAFCTAHCGTLYDEAVIAGSGHALTFGSQLQVYQGDGLTGRTECTSVQNAFGPVIFLAPSQWGRRVPVLPSVFLSEVITCLRAKE